MTPSNALKNSNPAANDRGSSRCDVITIHDLEVCFRVGVSEVERALPQRLLLTVAMDTDVSPAAAGDDLNRTIDYATVSHRLLHMGEGREWRLIETLAVDVAELVLRDFGAARVAIEVKKFILPEAGHVSVRIERPCD